MSRFEGKAHPTGGVKPMSIAGRYVRERERCLGMTDAEREFRAQWLKDQELAPNEPRVVPELYKFYYNPIRRMYRFPLDCFGKMLQPVLGTQGAAKVRYFTGKGLMVLAFAYAATYYFKYNANDWTRRGGWRVIESRTAVLEGDPGYPRLSDRTKSADYATQGFKDNTLKLN